MDDQSQGTTALSQVVINGVEYAPEEAQKLVELGNKTREYEQKWNTSLDKVWPEYGKLSQERNQWQSKEQQYQQQIAQFQQKQSQGVETSSDLAQARAAAKKLGIVLDEDLQNGKYVKADELDKWYEERRARDTERENQIKAVMSEAEKLEQTIDGSDGRPRFNKKTVLAYAGAYGFNDLQKAYEDMHADVLKQWKEEQVASSKKPGLKTLKPSGIKREPEPVKATNDNSKDLLKEALWGSND